MTLAPVFAASWCWYSLPCCLWLGAVVSFVVTPHKSCCCCLLLQVRLLLRLYQGVTLEPVFAGSWCWYRPPCCLLLCAVVVWLLLQMFPMLLLVVAGEVAAAAPRGEPPQCLYLQVHGVAPVVAPQGSCCFWLLLMF